MHGTGRETEKYVWDRSLGCTGDALEFPIYRAQTVISSHGVNKISLEINLIHLSNN